jgi:hypothetical protein
MLQLPAGTDMSSMHLEFEAVAGDRARKRLRKYVRDLFDVCQVRSATRGASEVEVEWECGAREWRDGLIGRGGSTRLGEHTNAHARRPISPLRMMPPSHTRRRNQRLGVEILVDLLLDLLDRLARVEVLRATETQTTKQKQKSARIRPTREVIRSRNRAKCFRCACRRTR